MAQVVCPNCGSKNPTRSLSCWNCGTPVAADWEREGGSAGGNAARILLITLAIIIIGVGACITVLSLSAS